MIATAGRAELIDNQVESLRAQRLQPDHVVICPSEPGDLPATLMELCRRDSRIHVQMGGKGLCAQRNAGLGFIFGQLGYALDDIIVAIDDDFVFRSDWLAECAALFSKDHDCVGATGVLAEDGVRNSGLCLDDARSILATGTILLPPGDWRRQAGEVSSLYGCNMAFRASALEGLTFDENLPIYGWLEDADISGQIATRGKLLRSDRMVGVHLGCKGGRVSGRRMGYSQFSNNFYLMKKGSIDKRLGLKLMRDCFMANLARYLVPEPWIDRRGRLGGNLEALWDIIRGVSNPRKINDF